jgi:flagellar export protein FliJ
VELGLARTALVEALAALEQLRGQRADLERLFAAPSGESVGQAKTVRLVIEQVDQGIHNARTVLALAEAAVAEKRRELEKAAQEREAVERVLAPRMAQVQALERLAEQKLEDEVTAIRFRTGETPS